MSNNILKKIKIKSIVSIWLDVSKLKIDICIMTNNDEFYTKIKNNKEWIYDFINYLKENDFSLDVPLVVESTWDYNTLFCLLCSESGFNVKEINPIITKSYTKSTIRGTKTDKTDSKLLANIWIINGKDLFTYKKDKKFISINKKISLGIVRK